MELWCHFSHWWWAALIVCKLITVTWPGRAEGHLVDVMTDDDLMTSLWIPARGNVDDGPVCELSSHHRHNVFTRSHHQTGSEQYQATSHHTVDIWGKWRKKMLVTPTHLPSLFPPESLRSRLLSWISMKGNCYFCNKLYRWCSEVTGKYILWQHFYHVWRLQRLHWHWLQC